MTELFEKTKKQYLETSKWMTLTETIPYMVSDSFKQRLLGELFQLGIRIHKLKNYLKSHEDNLLHAQLTSMNDSFNVLIYRIIKLKEKEGYDGW